MDIKYRITTNHRDGQMLNERKICPCPVMLMMTQSKPYSKQKFLINSEFMHNGSIIYEENSLPHSTTP